MTTSTSLPPERPSPRRAPEPSATRRMKAALVPPARFAFQRGTHASRHLYEPCPRRAVARGPRYAVRPAPRPPARPRQGADVLRHVHTVARGDEADPRSTRRQAVHPRHRPLFGLHGRADDPRQRPSTVRPARDRRALPPGQPRPPTRTSSLIPRTASPSAPGRSSWTSCAQRPPSGRASPRR